jgi:hypothetical protein
MQEAQVKAVEAAPTFTNEATIQFILKQNAKLQAYLDKTFNSTVDALTEHQQKVADALYSVDFGCNKKQVHTVISAVMGCDYPIKEGGAVHLKGDDFPYMAMAKLNLTSEASYTTKGETIAMFCGINREYPRVRYTPNDNENGPAYKGYAVNMPNGYTVCTEEEVRAQIAKWDGTTLDLDRNMPNFWVGIFSNEEILKSYFDVIKKVTS